MIARTWTVLLVTAAVGCGAERRGPRDADPCAGVACGVSEPPVTVIVRDAPDGTAVATAALTNVVVPPEAAERGGVSFGCATGPAATTCTIDASASGTYAFDVTAPGFRTAHVEVDVPAWTPIPGACCQPEWVAQTVEAVLLPE